MNITTQTPIEIDTEIFRLYKSLWAVEDKQASALDWLHIVVGDKKVYGWGRGQRQGVWQLNSEEVLEKAAASEEPRTITSLAKYDALTLEVAAIDEAIALLEAEYDRRGGWTRAYLVDNDNGHVHRSTHCSSWNRGFARTRFHWLTELSGHAESEIVELAGERACTICFPSAPVDALKRPTKLFGPQEQARIAAQAEKAAKKAQAASEAVVVLGFKDYGSARTHTFKTVRGATNAIAGELSSLVWYGETHPSAGDWVANIAKIRAALADKGVDYDFDKALAAARKKVTREGGTVKF